MDYDIGEAFQRIEDEMIASMSRNLKRHLSKEKEEGLNYAMWQAEQLKALDEFKRNNAEAFKDFFGIVNEQFGEILKKCNQTGQLEQEAKILEAIMEGWETTSKTAKGIQGTFFKINDRKLNALIKATKSDMAKAETAMLRQANDVYRKTIYNAQVYYNTGAGTLSQCVDMATKDFLAKGITCVEYANGAMVGIDTYSRMVLRTSQTRAYMMGEALMRDEWGINTVIVGNNGVACPLCLKWLGKVYYDDVRGNIPIPSPEKYPRLSTAIKGGLYHPNCRDTDSTYFEGISTPPKPMTKEQIEEANRVYRLEQKQRYNERQIRKFKRLVQGSVDPDNVVKYSQKLQQWQDYQKSFIAQNGDVLKRRAELEKVFDLPENLQWGQNTYDFSKDKNDIIKHTTKQKTKAFKEITDAMDFAYGDFTKEDYIAWMDAYDEHNKNVRLSSDELKIIDDYTEGSFVGLNDVCRYSDAQLLKKGYTAEDIERLRKKAETLEGALSKYDLDTDIVTHRFERDVTWLTGNGNGVDNLKRMIGEEYTAKGFTSSGMLPNRFRFTGGQADAVHFEIVTPKGTNGAFLSMSKKGENEFLYNRNTRFKVLDGGERIVKEQKFNFKTMQMEEIEVKERFLKVQVIPDDVVEVVEEVREAPKKPVFVPAKTREEAEEFIRKYVDENQFAALGVSYSGVSVETANLVNETLFDLYETYDIDKLAGVFVAKGNTKLGKTIDGAYAAYHSMRKSLLLNNKSLKNIADFARSHADELRFLKMYAKDPKSVMFKTKRAEEIFKKSVLSGRVSVPDTIQDAINHEMGHHLERTLSGMDKFDEAMANMPKYAEKISGYATTSKGEYIAESFASYRKGEGIIDPVLSDLFDSLRKGSDAVIVKHEETIIESSVKQLAKRSSKDFETIILPKKEYAQLMSELATNMTKEEKRQFVVSKPVGDYVYTVENHGFGDYRVIGKTPIDKEKVNEVKVFWKESEDK